MTISHTEFNKLLKRHTKSRTKTGVPPLTTEELFEDYQFYNDKPKSKNLIKAWKAIIYFKIAKWARRNGRRIVNSNNKRYQE